MQWYDPFFIEDRRLMIKWLFLPVITQLLVTFILVNQDK